VPIQKDWLGPLRKCLCKERAMSKLKVGGLVTYKPQSVHSRDAARGAYQVVRVMPSEKGLTSYRIKSVLEGHERVADEHELTKDV